ncbi:hypothetical protein Q4511_15555 [Paracoccus sp. 1_MG-2023]|nr:hypothetical protein [Paracoccus sp. 1_MG-2023]
MAEIGHLLVVTSGPGAAKADPIAKLAHRCFHTIPESGRAAIRAEIANGGAALP